MPVNADPVSKADGFRHRVQQVQFRADRAFLVEDNQEVHIGVGVVSSKRPRPKKPDLRQTFPEHTMVAIHRFGDSFLHCLFRRRPTERRSNRCVDRRFHL